MSPSVIIVTVTGLLGLYMAWNIGANDVANAMGCAVGSRSISIKWAIVAAAFCEFTGAVLVGANVTNTVRRGIVDPRLIASMPGVTPGEAATIMIIGMGAALLAAAVWLNIATWMGLPVSTTHSIVGAVVGFGLVAACTRMNNWWTVVDWKTMGRIVASWFLSPIAGGVAGYLIFRTMSSLILGRRRPAPAAIKIAPFVALVVGFVVTFSIVYKGLKHLTAEQDAWLFWLTDHPFMVASVAGLAALFISGRSIKHRLKDKRFLPLTQQLESVEQVFGPLVVVSSCAVAFSQGANDVANAIGPLAAIIDIVKSGTVAMTVEVPKVALMLGGIGIVVGLATYGYRVIATIGRRITEITPSRGVAAAVAATVTVLTCTKMGLPVSTTHVLVGAVLGIGLARGLGGVNRKVAQNIIAAWFITVPAGAVLAVIFYKLAELLFFNGILAAITSSTPPAP